MTKYCKHCGKRFEPRPQVLAQTYCAKTECQRARKRQWQREKMLSDQHYQINQRSAQRAWSQRNTDYWQQQRQAKQGQEKTDEVPNQGRGKSSAPSRGSSVVKMDVCRFPTGLYRITLHPDFTSEEGGPWIVQIDPFKLP